MNCTMITNQAHACKNNPLPSPLREPESKDICFSTVLVCPLFSKFRVQQNHKYVSKHGTFWPLFCFLNAFSKALIGKKQKNMSSSSLAAQLCTNRCQNQRKLSFYLKLVYELYNDNKPGPRMHEPPPSLPLRVTIIQKNRFQHSASIFLQVQRSAKP